MAQVPPCKATGNRCHCIGTVLVRLGSCSVLYAHRARTLSCDTRGSVQGSCWHSAAIVLYWCGDRGTIRVRAAHQQGLIRVLGPTSPLDSQAPLNGDVVGTVASPCPPQVDVWKFDSAMGCNDPKSGGSVGQSHIPLDGAALESGGRGWLSGTLAPSGMPGCGLSQVWLLLSGSVPTCGAGGRADMSSPSSED